LHGQHPYLELFHIASLAGQLAVGVGSYYLSTWLTQGFEKDDGGWGTIILT
jgi:hypothetical protein